MKTVIGEARNERLTIGLDLGNKSSAYCVLNGSGKVISEHKVRTTPKALSDCFSGMAVSRIALETGTHSPWISRLLSGIGHEVIVPNARHVRLIAQSRQKDDGLDARTLHAWRESIRNCYHRSLIVAHKHRQTYPRFAHGLRWFDQESPSSTQLADW